MNLDDFIDKRAQDGELHSVGDFTVDSLAALRKTLASSLPEPHFYLFQIIQSLVQSRVTDIKVAIGRSENRVSFQDPLNLYADLENLASRFNNALSVASNEPSNLLMSGMVTSLSSHVTRAEFHYGEDKLIVSSAGLSQEKLLKPVKTPSVILHRTMEKGLSFSWSRIWGARKEEFRVRKAFEHSPIAISIAGLPTVPHSSWRRGIEGDGRFALVEAVVLTTEEKANHRGEPQLVADRVEGDPFLYRCEPSPSMSEDLDSAVAPDLLMMACDETGAALTQDLETEAWDRRRWSICFTTCDNPQAELLFVRNGMGIAKHQLDMGIRGLQIVAPADHLTVDASGYQLIQNEAYEKSLDEAKFVLQNVRACLDKDKIEKALRSLGKDPEKLLATFDWL